ncbi:unnamed protein product [Acanthoscelides obtectus]|uniref:Uncharacterized protein n=1 Tax=Acanthoscelides obtectus TaxID=200917 RepID=A0A9P0L9W4_ACAOB|nr:unnamed protein product [Acanthoscelides obtectus]CAK1651829.1 Nucleoprotein [Acanthoscelides obtectus]
MYYQGFNPLKLRTVMQNREPNIGSFTSDIARLIVIYLVRGTNIKKTLALLATTNSRGASEIAKLKEKYRILEPGSNLSTESVTMQRIAACFPEEVMKAILALDSTGRFSPITTDLPESFPSVLMTPVAASAIPRKEGSSTKKLLEAHLIFLLEMDNVMNPKNRTKKDKIKQYQMAAHNSPLLTETQRRNFCDLFGLASETDQGFLINPNVSKCIKEYNERSNSYSD